MEAVKAFNGELYSLNEYKPPISKAKMTQITKSAIKAIKGSKCMISVFLARCSTCFASSSPSSPKALKVKQEDGAWESFKEIREPLTSLGRRWAVLKRRMEEAK